MPFDGHLPSWEQQPNPSWWGARVRTPDGRLGRSESNPDPRGPHFLIHVRFDDGSGEWFRQSRLKRL